MGFGMPGKLTDEELVDLCKKAIKDGWSKHRLFFHIRAQGKSLYEQRLYRIWAQCGGITQHQYHPERL
jgi:hypothetical protein